MVICDQKRNLVRHLYPILVNIPKSVSNSEGLRPFGEKITRLRRARGSGGGVETCAWRKFPHHLQNPASAAGASALISENQTHTKSRAFSNAGSYTSSLCAGTKGLLVSTPSRLQLAKMRVPSPGVLSICTSPPRAFRRSCIEKRPTPMRYSGRVASKP